METTVERTNDNKARLTVTVPAQDVDRAIEQAYADVAKNVRIPGFRPGKAPKPIIDTQIGRERVLAEALETVVSDAYPLAVEAEDLHPIDQPEFDGLDVVEPGKEFTFTAELELRPELELKFEADETITVNVPPQKASEREIDAQVDWVRERYATLAPVEDRGVEHEDFVLVSFTGLVDGEPYEGNTVDHFLYEMGRGQMPKEFDEAMLGAKAGEQRVAEFDIPDTSSNPEFVGKRAHFDIAVHEVKAKVLPDADDEFAANVGFDTVGEMRADIRERLDASKAVGHIREVERSAVGQLAERVVVGELPEALVKRRVEQMGKEFMSNLEGRGMSLEQYVQATGVEPDRIEADILLNAAGSIREELALEALARREGLDVTEGDIREEVARLSSDTDVESALERLRGAGAIVTLKEQLARRKAVRWLMEHVDVVEVEPSEEGRPEAEASETEPERPKKAKKEE